MRISELRALRVSGSIRTHLLNSYQEAIAVADPDKKGAHLWPDQVRWFPDIELVTHRGYGCTQPLPGFDDGQNHPENRRVMVRLLEPDHDGYAGEWGDTEESAPEAFVGECKRAGKNRRRRKKRPAQDSGAAEVIAPSRNTRRGSCTRRIPATVSAASKPKWGSCVLRGSLAVSRCRSPGSALAKDSSERVEDSRLQTSDPLPGAGAGSGIQTGSQLPWACARQAERQQSAVCRPPPVGTSQPARAPPALPKSRTVASSEPSHAPPSRRPQVGTRAPTPCPWLSWRWQRTTALPSGEALGTARMPRRPSRRPRP